MWDLKLSCLDEWRVQQRCANAPTSQIATIWLVKELSIHPPQRLPNPRNRLFHPRPARHLQPQLPGDVVDDGGVKREAACVHRLDEVVGALFGGQGLAPPQQEIKPVHGRKDTAKRSCFRSCLRNIHGG